MRIIEMLGIKIDVAPHLVKFEDKKIEIWKFVHFLKSHYEIMNKYSTENDVL